MELHQSPTLEPTLNIDLLEHRQQLVNEQFLYKLKIIYTQLLFYNITLEK